MYAPMYVHAYLRVAYQFFKRFPPSPCGTKNKSSPVYMFPSRARSPSNSEARAPKQKVPVYETACEIDREKRMQRSSARSVVRARATASHTRKRE